VEIDVTGNAPLVSVQQQSTHTTTY
jgi:hypothetical protein